MTHRYFVDAPVAGDRAVLADSEAHHLIHVMRAKVGESITLFDGSGFEYRAEITRIGRAEVELRVLDKAAVDRELTVTCTLGVALPKGDRQGWLVEKAVELGVTHIVPLVTARGVAQPVDKALIRLRRAVIEASKQCGRNRLLEIGEPRDWASFVQESPPSARRLMAHPGGQLQANELRAAGEPTSAFVIGIGPEGGFSEQEVGLALAAGWQTVDLGPRILRVETAALSLAAAVAALE